MDCPLCNIPFREPLLWRNGDFFICETNPKKKHNQRIMIAAYEHISAVSEEKARKAFFQLINFSLTFFRQNWSIRPPFLRSIPEHWHIVAETNDVLCKKNLPKIWEVKI